MPPDEQPEIQLWTLEGLEEVYYDSMKKGAQKLGVKSLPKIRSINVEDIVLPVTHIGLGIDNDIIAAFEDKVEVSIVHVPPEDVTRRRRLQALLPEIEEKRKAIGKFDVTPKRKLLDKLQQQKRDAGKVMSLPETLLLNSLDVQRKALVATRAAAKRNKDSNALDCAKKALLDFGNAKEGGRRRQALMNKNRRSGHQLTPEEEKTLGELVTMRKNLDKQRDSAVKEQKELKDKLKEILIREGRMQAVGTCQWTASTGKMAWSERIITCVNLVVGRSNK